MGSNMGSSHNQRISSLRRTLHLKAKNPDTHSLKTLGQMLGKPHRLILAKKYGNILDMLEVDVQVEAITALAQYYDPPLRCFTFSDFQLAPTLEEFERILGLPLENKKPYHYLGHYCSLQAVAEILKVHVEVVKERKKIRGKVEGFTREYLEKHLHCLAEDKDWDTFIDVLALTIYGLFIFPSVDGFVDLAAIDVFVALKMRGENPVPSILCDVYYTLNFCFEKKGKRILCCLPMLFVWLTARIFKRDCVILCPFVDLERYQLKIKSSQEWAQSFAQLDERSIRWILPWAKAEMIIYQCGDFPNVPLLGTRGCINYNPSLLFRQFGYPMVGAPTNDMTTPFIFYDLGSDSIEILKRIRRAWSKVVRKGKELKTQGHEVKRNYYQWVKNQAEKVKMPFQPFTLPTTEESSMPVSPEMEEVLIKLSKVEAEKLKLKEKLSEALQTCGALKRENTEREQNFEKVSKKAKMDNEYTAKVKECLRAANRELGLRRQERDKALAENQELKNLVRAANIAKKSVEKQVTDMKLQIEEMLADHEEKERGMQGDIHKLLDHTDEQGEIIVRDKYEIDHWMTRFSNLASLANGAIADVQYKLKMADGVTNPLTIPMEILDFIEYCKNLICEMKELADAGM